MTRHSSLCGTAVLVLLAGNTPASAQPTPVGSFGAVKQVAAVVAQGRLQGTVLDQRGQPLGGAMVSAVGATSSFVLSESDGRFTFRNLPAGPYLVRAHLQGYIPPRARVMQVNAAGFTTSTIALTRRAPLATETPQVLEAGVGATMSAGESPSGGDSASDQGEVAWRLRHVKRSVLKDARIGDLGGDGDRFAGDSPAGQHVASGPGPMPGWLAALPVNGEINLLTSTSFDRPTDLFAPGGAPQGATYFALSAPTGAGDWAMGGAMAQGTLSSWIVSGSYLRRAPAAHQYEAGISYGTQRFLGAGTDALAAAADASRNVGAMYAIDHWTAGPHVRLSYGAKYARYDYLTDRGLLSPSASVTITPDEGSTLRVHGSASRREVAPGAGELIPPSTGPWLPPERTFSPISPRSGFTPERIDHLEVSVERQWLGDFAIAVRGFREDVRDQIVTLFGVALPDSGAGYVGRYYVGSAGDYVARGWGLGVSRRMGEGLRAAVEYTQTDADWRRVSPDHARLEALAASGLRSEPDRTYDLTTSVEGQLPGTATRVFVVYKINNGFAATGSTSGGCACARFDIRLNQALPFLNFAAAQWEMLVAVRNVFGEELLSGSIYDELLVVRPPKRVVGGLTVRF